MKKISTKRTIAVTLGLALTGAVCGAALGGMTFLISIARGGDGVHGLLGAVGLFGMGGIFGSVFGALLAPPVAWLFLRRLPLGRAIIGTGVGVLAGIVVGEATAIGGGCIGGLAGFVIAGPTLWLHDWRKARLTRPTNDIAEPDRATGI